MLLIFLQGAHLRINILFAFMFILLMILSKFILCISFMYQYMIIYTRYMVCM